MSSDVVIKVENLSKCYHIYKRPRDRLWQALSFGRKQYYREFWALKDISFEIKKGETVGIMGRNGAGKSTLLQLICGTLSPTSGTIQTSGRIAALLELGSGFNPEFTGRENVYMSGALLGLSKKAIDERFDDIAAFADIGDFIEDPVKKYSSGMYLRLAFSVQSQLDPDILIVDEALSVGDAKFQAKCFERLRQLKDRGTSILLVTHSSEQVVTHCSNAILLDAGRQLEMGEPRRIVNHYLDLLFGADKKMREGASSLDVKSVLRSAPEKVNALSTQEDLFSAHTGYNPSEYRWGDGAAAILDYRLVVGEALYPAAISGGESAILSLSVRFYDELVRPILGVTIRTKEGVTVCGVNSETLGCMEFQSMGAKGSVAQVEARFVCRLAPGDYFISLGIATRHGEIVTPHDRRYDAIHLVVRPDPRLFGLVDLDIELAAERVDV